MTVKEKVRIGVKIIIIIMGVKAGYAANVQGQEWPISVSGLNGWNGFEIVKDIQCSDCYTLKIPSAYGLDNHEFKVLVSLHKKRLGMSYDLDGPLFDDVAVLDHLLKLAIRNNYKRAGRAILNPRDYNMQIGLETSQNLFLTHVIPLLMEFENLDYLLEGLDREKLAEELCVLSSMRRDFRDVNKLIEKLNSSQYVGLSEVLLKRCDMEKEIMRKYDETFME